MDISIRGTKGLGNSAVKLVFKNSARTVLKQTDYLTEAADSDSTESDYYATGIAIPSGAVSVDITVSATGRVWGTLGLVPASSDYPTAVTYNTHGDIATVTWKSGKSWTYGYNGSYQLTGITEA